MITEQTVHDEIWPVVQSLIAATLAGDEKMARRQLVPNRPVADMLQMFGITALDIFLKTILMRGRCGVRQAILTDNGRFVYIEYVWEGGVSASNDLFTAEDSVTVKMRRYRDSWRADDINPSSIELLLSAPRARAIMFATDEFQKDGTFPQHPWVLPVALYSGLLQLPPLEQATEDAVETAVLAQMQGRNYEILAHVHARRLWRDFKRKVKMKKVRPSEAGAYAAAVEFVMNEQTASDLELNALCDEYDALPQIAERFVKRIKQALKIEEMDKRYSTLMSEEVRIK